MAAYMPTLIKTAWRRPQLRTIPVNRSIRPELAVMTYERAEGAAGPTSDFRGESLYLPTRAHPGGSGL